MIVVILLSLIYIVLPFLINKQNADSLLSGYSNMNEEEKANFDLEGYLLFFKKYFIFNGIFQMLIGLVVYYCIDQDSSIIAVVNWMLLSLVVFTFIGQRFHKVPNRKQKRMVWLGIIILVLTFVFFNIDLWYTYKDNEFVVKSNAIEITGKSGIGIQLSDIKSVNLVNSLPKLRGKRHGSALEHIYKGKFNTQNNDVVRLIINDVNKLPYLEIITIHGDKIYYNSKTKPSEIIVEELGKVL
ncbi:MAG: DUF3784 domain-containing protein [Bacteroidota bacterium]|nr:DUF3784 domain-containing protein [Bacteroidota bacterium]